MRAAESTAALIYERFGDLIVGEGSENVVHDLIRCLRATGGGRSRSPNPARGG